MDPDLLAQLWELNRGALRRQELGRISADYDETMRWVDPRGYTLSDRVWLQGQRQQSEVMGRIRRGIAAGDDVLDIAGELEQYLRPELQPQRTVGGRIVHDGRSGVITGMPRGGRGSYGARRLVRTEISKAYGDTVDKAAEALDLYTRWMLSNRHPKEDICDRYAEGSSSGTALPRGVYRRSEFPPYPPHPQCLCTKTTWDERSDDELLSHLREKYGLE